MLKNVFPNSFLQMGTIFLSIIIEALPFVLLGCVVSGCLQVFLSVERVEKILPKRKLAAILFGCLLGFFFPSCECGIVPIVNRFIEKKVPVYVAFPFMLTAPIVNPVVLFSTYMAFGNTWRFALLRVVGAMIVALVIGSWLAFSFKGTVVKGPSFLHAPEHHAHDFSALSLPKKLQEMSIHAVDEFFDSGRYLIFGSLIASFMQAYVPTGVLTSVNSSKFLSVFLLLTLALLLSLCSEADAFIGSSLLSLFGTGPIVAFLVYGPMVDIKNLLLMKRYFQTGFIVKFVGIVTGIVYVFALFA